MKKNYFKLKLCTKKTIYKSIVALYIFFLFLFSISVNAKNSNSDKINSAENTATLILVSGTAFEYKTQTFGSSKIIVKNTEKNDFINQNTKIFLSETALILHKKIISNVKTLIKSNSSEKRDFNNKKAIITSEKYTKEYCSFISPLKDSERFFN